MKISIYCVTFGLCVGLAAGRADAQTVTALGSGFSDPTGVAVDSDGNVFVVDAGNGQVKEIVAVNGVIPSSPTIKTISGSFLLPHSIAIDSAKNLFVSDSVGLREIFAASGYTTSNPIGSGLELAAALTVDAQDNVFVADLADHSIKEVLAAGGFNTVNTLVGNLGDPAGVAVDSSGNVFFTDSSKQLVEEITAVNGSIPASPTVKPVGSGFNVPVGIAIDPGGNLFITDTGNNDVKEIVAAGGYVTVDQVATSFNFPASVTLDGLGDVFITDTRNNAVKEIQSPSPLLAAVLPDSRSVQIGSPATIFATMINTGSTTLGNCTIALPPTAPAGLTLSFQTTDPTSNKPTGTINTPATIAGSNGKQSFLVSLQGTAAFDAAGLPLAFICTGSTPAPDIVGVDTVDLDLSTTAVPDIIALSATATSDGIVGFPQADSGAFAIASTNAGAAGTITVSLDTGSASIPVTPTICQTNPSNGQCINAPAATVSLDFAAEATPTFSVFLTASAAVPLAPASSRLFVRFKDANGNLHGSTSVAIETN